MSEQHELRDRIEEIIWKRTVLPTETTTFVAQAIIDEFGLTYGYRTAHSQDHPDGENQKRFVGKWEPK